MIRVPAASFEITRNEVGSAGSRTRELSGYVDVNDVADAFEALEDLCSRKDVDKVVIVYQNYSFCLVGVSFSKNNENPPRIMLGKSYKFTAKDVELERSS